MRYNSESRYDKFSKLFLISYFTGAANPSQPLYNSYLHACADTNGHQTAARRYFGV